MRNQWRIILLSFTLTLCAEGLSYGQTIAYGIDGSNYPTINFVSVPLPEASPISTIGATAASEQGGDFGPEGLFYGRAGGSLVTISLDDGGISTVGDITGIAGGQTIIGMGFDESTSKMFVCATNLSAGGSELYILDLATAEAASTGMITNASSILAIAVNPAGEIYAFDDGGDNLVRVDPETGEGTVIGSLTIGTFAQDADFDAATGILYWTYFFEGSGRLATVDVTTAESTPVTAWSADLAAFAILNTPSTRVQTGNPEVPLGFQLLQNYPNPFNPETTIDFQLAQSESIELAIFNILGEKVRQIVAGQQPAGSHRALWDGRDDNGVRLSGGLYFYRLLTPSFSQTRKMVLAP